MMISKLIEEALLIKLVLKPEEILINFEHAFTHYFPDVTIMGCYFNFGQCLYRNLCLHGMKSQYTNDEKLKIWLKSLISLALIPTKSVQDEFVDLQEQAQGIFNNFLNLTIWHNIYVFLITNFYDSITVQSRYNELLYNEYRATVNYL